MSAAMISTTKLAEKCHIETKVLFKLLAEHGFIERADNKWRLTAHGEFTGGTYQQSEKFGEFIVWPESFTEHELLKGYLPEWISATKIGQLHQLSARTVNALLSELGLMNKDQRGWLITPRGSLLGGEQRSSKQGFYTLWPAGLLQHDDIQSALANVAGEEKQLSLDAHHCECLAEQKLCNWLYLHHIAHAYKRTLPGSDYSCSFYLPERKIYIDYFGIENMKQSLSLQMDKQAFYQQHGLHCIELHDEDIRQLDDVLPQKLLQFGLQLHP